MYVRLCVCVHVLMYACMYVCMHACTCVCVCVCMCLHACCTCVHADIKGPVPRVECVGLGFMGFF